MANFMENLRSKIISMHEKSLYNFLEQSIDICGLTEKDIVCEYKILEKEGRRERELALEHSRKADIIEKHSMVLAEKFFELTGKSILSQNNDLE